MNYNKLSKIVDDTFREQEFKVGKEHPTEFKYPKTKSIYERLMSIVKSSGIKVEEGRHRESFDGSSVTVALRTEDADTLANLLKKNGYKDIDVSDDYVEVTI